MSEWKYSITRRSACTAASRAGAGAALLAIAAGLLSCAAANPVVRKADMPGIENFSRIDDSSGLAGPSVGFGGATSPSAMPALESAGFRSVINLRSATENGAEIEASRAAAEAAGLHYINLPFDPKNPGATIVDEFLAAVGDKANQPVYIHCGSATRAATLWMIGRVLADGWDTDAAAAEARVIAAKPDDAVAFAKRYLESQAD